jgi:hypothetical protein
MTSGPIYPSKRDWWLTAIIWGGIATMLAPALILGRAIQPVAGPFPLSWAVPLAGAGFMLWVLYGTSYRFAGDQLDIRCGPFRFRVPLSEIDSVEPTHNPLSSPACSLDRLLLRYGARRIMVSPADKSGFLADLELRCPRIRRVGF